MTPPPATASDLRWATAIHRDQLQTLQLNLGRFCNLACTHCHIEAGPKRQEMISDEVRASAIEWIQTHRPAVVDLTGGAPELIPGFRDLVLAARAAGAQVIDRCNLAVLQEPGQEDLAEFLAEHQVQVVASLPCYLQDNVDRQRGKGTYDRSIQGLRQLNAVGYGVAGSDLPLYLVYNPGGASLPPNQADLEPSYRERLADDWGIQFTGLWCLANVAIKRFRKFLERRGELEAYEQKLVEAFNPTTLNGLMCRSTLSVDWTGRCYDCDFNLAIDLGLGDTDQAATSTTMLWDVTPDQLAGRAIATGRHCLACTAGCGSSCTGAVA